MSHNLINNIIPGAIGLAVILGGIAWCIIADSRAQNGRPPLRLRLGARRAATAKRVPLAPAPRSPAEPERDVVTAH